MTVLDGRGGREGDEISAGGAGGGGDFDVTPIFFYECS